MEYILAFWAVVLVFLLIRFIRQSISPEKRHAKAAWRRYNTALKKDMKELKSSPFLDLAETAMCREIELQLGPKHRFTPGVYYLDQAQLRGPCDIDCSLSESNDFVLTYAEIGYDNIRSNIRRDAVTLHLIPRLQAKYPQLGIECSKVLEHDRKDPMTLYEHKAILVNYALVNSSPLKQV